MLDLTNEKTEGFNSSQHALENISGGKAYALLSSYPEQIFDPRPYSINIASKQINELMEKKSIVIVFCGGEITREYDLVEITANGPSVKKKLMYSNLTFYKDYPRSNNLHGNKVKLPEKETILSSLLSNYLDDFEYKNVFFHPQVYKENIYEEAKDFLPLLFNERSEIISYAHFKGESLVLVFPNVGNKASFIANLFKTYLPEIKSSIFPFHGEFGWLKNGEYLLPGERELLKKKADIKEKYIKDITENDDLILQLKKDFKFLSDMISETGSVLVSSIEKYLKWLGFSSVVNLDDTNPDVLEEDIPS